MKRIFKCKPVIQHSKEDYQKILDSCNLRIIRYPENCNEHKKIEKQIIELQEKINKK